VGGYAHFMVRTRSGRFGIGDAVTLEELAAAAAGGTLEDALCSMDQAIAHLPVVDLSERSVSDVMHGHPVPLWKVAGTEVPEDGPVRLRSRRGRLIALARVDGGALRPFKVLVGDGGGLIAHRSRPQ
jgi:tRNA pseudouridine55 synthase